MRAASACGSATEKSRRAANTHPIALLEEPKNTATVLKFIDLNTGLEAKVLESAGFAAP